MSFASQRLPHPQRSVRLVVGAIHATDLDEQPRVLDDESSYVNATTFLVDGGISGAYVTPLAGE